MVAEGGFKPCAELLRYKNHAAQRDTLWALATLAGNTEMNHEGIIIDVGWNTILSRASSKLPDLQRPAVTLIANLSMNGMETRGKERGGKERGLACGFWFATCPDLLAARTCRGEPRHDHQRRRPRASQGPLGYR